MQKIKRVVLATLLSSALLLNFAPSLAYAAPNPAKDAIQQGTCDASGQAVCDTDTATNSLNNTIAKVINILSVIVGIVAVIMIIVAGFRYITAAGNDQAVAGAKKTLLYAIIGLIIVALAQVIVRFVLNKVT